MAVKFKLESGEQLLSRLTKKTSLKGFYPHLFQTGPCFRDIIEISSNTSPNFLLNELITETLIPEVLGGLQSGSLMFVTDGNFEYSSLIKLLKNKLLKYSTERSYDISNGKIDYLLELAVKNFHLVYIYDATQMYVTIQNLDAIMVKHQNISLIVFDTLTAFYWSEQDYKIMKMNMYLKHLIKTLQTVTRTLKVVVVYTRPQYFSNKESVELEPCCHYQTNERINYRIQIIQDVDSGQNVVSVQTHDNNIKKTFTPNNEQIIWI